MSKLFGFISIIPPQTISAATDNTSSSEISTWQWFSGFWKNMTSYAVSFPGMDTRYTIRTKHIKTLLNNIDMVGITATRIITDNMVKHINSIIFRQWPNKYLVKKSVHFCCLATKIKCTITTIFGGKPNPAPICRVNGYFG